MKKSTLQIWAIIITALLICLADNGFSQNAVKDAQGNYRAVKINKDSATAIATGSQFIDYDGSKYPVFQSAKGRLFIRRNSAKTGKQYNFYLKL